MSRLRKSCGELNGIQLCVLLLAFFPKQCVHFCAEHNVFSFWAFLTDAAAVEVGVKVSVVPHKAVAEVSKIGNL